MISNKSFDLLIKFLKAGIKLHAFSFQYDTCTGTICQPTLTEKLKWLVYSSFSYFYGLLHCFIILVRIIVDKYPIAMLLQELYVPLGYGVYATMNLTYILFQSEVRDLLNRVLKMNSKFGKQNQMNLNY